MNYTLIGKGNTAEIYDIGDGKILKLFWAGYPQDAVAREFSNAKLLSDNKLSVPTCYEWKEVEGRYGIVYEKIEGIDLLEHMITTDKAEQDIVAMVKLQEEILSFMPADCTGIDIIDYRDFMCRVIGERYPEIIKQINELPSPYCICHGDFHPGNIMVTKDGRYVVIDFMNICYGTRLYDVARTYSLIHGFEGDSAVDNAPEEVKQLMAARVQIAEYYLELMHTTKEEIESYLSVIAKCHECEMIKS